MLKINPYLSFDGNCAEAFRFYEKILRPKSMTLFTYGESPMADRIDPSARHKILHAQLTLEGGSLMGADAPECGSAKYQKPQGMGVTLHAQEPEEAQRLFAALSEGGSVTMPMAETFWAKRFGMCTDRFQIPWMVNCSKAEGCEG
ncbi:MAG: VOC family protein [Methylacidiphilaceae bacterium]|nr:VOC family protein [Candidatus Methylacidiphilaceae bacterium]